MPKNVDLPAQFQAKLDELAAEFQEKLAKVSAEYEEKLAKERAAYEERLAKYEDKLTALTAAFQEQESRVPELEAGPSTDTAARDARSRSLISTSIKALGFPRPKIIAFTGDPTVDRSTYPDGAFDALQHIEHHLQHVSSLDKVATFGSCLSGAALTLFIQYTDEYALAQDGPGALRRSPIPWEQFKSDFLTTYYGATWAKDTFQQLHDTRMGNGSARDLARVLSKLNCRLHRSKDPLYKHLSSDDLSLLFRRKLPAEANRQLENYERSLKSPSTPTVDILRIVDLIEMNGWHGANPRVARADYSSLPVAADPQRRGHTPKDPRFASVVPGSSKPAFAHAAVQEHVLPDNGRAGADAWEDSEPVQAGGAFASYAHADSYPPGSMIFFQPES